MARRVWLILSTLLLAAQIYSQEAILRVSDGSVDKDYCLVYNASWTPLPSSLAGATRYPLVNLTSSFLCAPADGGGGLDLRGKAVAVMRGQCPFSQKAEVAQGRGAAALLVASNEVMFTPSANDTEYDKVNISLALMRYRDFIDAHKVFGEKMSAQIYAPIVPAFDMLSIVVMLVIAVFTVGMGGYWSGACEKEKQNDRQSLGSSGAESSDAGDIALYSPLKVVVFVGLMCVMLVLMYFFFKWLVYAMIVIFCLASATALYSCLDALMSAVGCSTCSFSCQNRTISVRSLLLAALCITVAVVWGVYRNEDRWIWILQDMLGIAFCLNFMKSITLSNFKISVILLSLLLLYDVFFVFITPFFTSNGESIMVQVALGPESSMEKTNGNVVEVSADPTATYEKLPVVMRVPRFSAIAQNLCGMQFSILGYGDIIVPGLLVAYCHRFDVWINSSYRVYFVSCTIAYCLGMIVTFVVMILSKMGQPALLYLVPFTLLTSTVVAWRRKEMQQFWAGTTYQVLDSTREPLLQDAEPGYSSGEKKC
ncbi:signal peptide peptidase-like 2A isoform X1 [Denticeps clupeoides]|uniref:Signal peptide peptidase like 2A n=1 Tax=Denticeps clupeoides TaxID=299321 RepID=A0AAY4ELU0_9TELE|nr:signal peptide peptidase-like 2A isoform X1 [Denticeps clupeoides]